MKKFLSLIMLCVLCMLMAACGNGDSAVEQPVAFWPDIPKKLKEVVRYEYRENGFYIVKAYVDRKGNCLEEHYYGIDDQLYIIDCEIVAYNTVDKKGNLLKSEGHYIFNPCYATRETVLVIEAIDHDTYDYQVLDEDGNVELYVKETENEKGWVTKEEYFTKSGRFVRVEEAEYRDDGTASAYRGRNAKNELTYETKCDEKGNFLSCTVYDERGDASDKYSAEYHENGTIKAYNHTVVYDNGQDGDTTTVYDFDEDGKIKSRFGGYSYNYDEDGMLRSVYSYSNSYGYDEKGYLTSQTERSSGVEIRTTYTYDEQGRLASCVTQNKKNSAQTTVDYQYRVDGSVVISHTNVYGITNNIIYTDIKGRIIRNEIHNNVGRTSYQTVEYDANGNVTKISDYENEKISKELLYQYNEHGDLVGEEESSYYSSGVGKKYTEYEYFENGYLKSRLSYDGLQRMLDKIVYDENGGYTVTSYAAGRVSSIITYDKYDKLVKSEYFDVFTN